MRAPYNTEPGIAPPPARASAIPPVSKVEEIPDSASWEDATVANVSEEIVAAAARELPRVEPTPPPAPMEGGNTKPTEPKMTAAQALARATRAYSAPAQVGAAPAQAAPPPAPAPAPAPAALLSSAQREDVWTIVRAAVEQAIQPLVVKQREMEARLERSERAQEARETQPRDPYALEDRTSTRAVSKAPAALPGFTPAAGRVAPKPAPNADHDAVTAAYSSPPVSLRPSLVTTSYGTVVVPQEPRRELDLASVALSADDIEGFDGGRRKRLVGRVIAVLLVLMIGGAITATIVSRS